MPVPMMRLLQGDVGSGKTAVAFLALLAAAGSGYQSVLMAPTEVSLAALSQTPAVPSCWVKSMWPEGTGNTCSSGHSQLNWVNVLCLSYHGLHLATPGALI